MSPIAVLLALLNCYFAWDQAEPVRTLWLVASVTILIKSVATYTYFAPVMIRVFERPEGMDTIKLRRMISVWTALQPVADRG